MGRASTVIFELIEERLKAGADLEEIDKKIWAMFGETWAILCSDMSGFSRRTDEFGIIHFLSLIYEMQKLMKPIILKRNGFLMKTEADNLFVIFRDPEYALRCAIEMHKATIDYNLNKTTNYQIAVCIGIGYGRVLKLGDEDCFGSEVNKAFKLGEDIGGPGDTLLTPDAYEAIRELTEFEFSVAGPRNTGLFAGYYRLENAIKE